MKSTVEHLSPTRVRINVEVPFDEFKSDFDRYYRRIAQQVRIPGFRPGKAPAKVIESRIGRQPIVDEVVNEAIPAKYMEAVTTSELRAIGRPEIEVTEVEDGKYVAFTAVVDVRPDITIPEFDDLTVTVDDVEVTDEEIGEQLDELRARFGTLTGANRPAETGDFVSIDLVATVDGTEVEDAKTTGLSYEIGSGNLVEGIDDALVGTPAGESTTFTTKLLAGEFTGQDADVTVTVQSVKVRELPEPDDEFAQLASEFDTIDELRADLRERLSRVKRMQQGVQARDKVLEVLLERIEVPMPEGVVEAEVDTRKHDAVHAFDHDEERLAEFLKSQDKTVEQFDEEVRSDAEKSVKTQLILDSIAEAQNVGVNDNELSERIIYQAQRFGISPDEYVRRAQESGQLGAIFADVKRGKALATVVRKATVVDESGNTVDLDELFGRPEEPAPADDAPAAEIAEEESTADK